MTPTENTKPKSYHFDAGDSATGKIGFCARVTATSEAEAVRLLNEALAPFHDGAENAEIIANSGPIEYVTAYFGYVTADDIDFVSEEEAA